MENKIYRCFLHIPTFQDSFIRAYLKANYLLITKRLLLNRRLDLLYIEKVSGGTFMVVQRLTLHFPMQGIRVQSLVRELRSHMPCSQKTKNRSNFGPNSIKTLKTSHIKKNLKKTLTGIRKERIAICCLCIHVEMGF